MISYKEQKLLRYVELIAILIKFSFCLFGWNFNLFLDVTLNLFSLFDYYSQVLSYYGFYPLVSM